MKITNARVHMTHCCIKHGCKYGDEECPIVLGLIKQLYQCEECNMKYANPKIAKECENWCSQNHSCNMQIIKNALKEG